MTIAIKTTTSLSSMTLPTQITARRATCLGTQYRVADTLGTHAVTIKNGCIGCSCGLDRSFLTCEHITLVEQQEAVYATEAVRRSIYTETFAIY